MQRLKQRVLKARQRLQDAQTRYEMAMLDAVATFARQGMSLREIAVVLEISHQRVAQLREKALTRSPS